MSIINVKKNCPLSYESLEQVYKPQLSSALAATKMPIVNQVYLEAPSLEGGLA